MFVRRPLVGTPPLSVADDSLFVTIMWRVSVFVFSSIRYCPECCCDDVRKSRRRGFKEKVILPLFFLRPYRCVACYTRYIGLSFATRVKNETPGELIRGNPAALPKTQPYRPGPDVQRPRFADSRKAG